MTAMIKLLVCLSLLCNAVAFAPSMHGKFGTRAAFASQKTAVSVHPEAAVLDKKEWKGMHFMNNVKLNSLAAAGLTTGAFSMVGTALAEVNANDVEIAELPPVWIPVVFAVCLLLGVGALTLGLGDVMTEESQLGMQSGARAKKEMDRSRSSYFKK